MERGTTKYLRQDVITNMLIASSVGVVYVIVIV